MGDILTEKENKEVKSRKNDDDDDIMLEIVTEAMREKKADNIVSLDLGSLSKSIFDEFVIASADSSIQVRAVADNVEEKMYESAGVGVRSRQGDENGIWIILDYGRLVVHVFRTDCRKYYKLEDLWADAEVRRYE